MPALETEGSAAAIGSTPDSGRPLISSCPRRIKYLLQAIKLMVAMTKVASEIIAKARELVSRLIEKFPKDYGTSPD